MTRVRAAFYRLIFVVAVLWVFRGGGVPTLGASGAHRPKCEALRFSGKEKFPSPENKLLRLRDEQRIAEMRAHAWRLFAGLTDAEGPEARRPPIWDTWYTECEVKLLQCLPSSTSNTERLLNGFSIPAQNLPTMSLDAFLSENKLTDKDFGTLQNNIRDVFRKDPQLASVLYNEPARNHILDNHLYSPKILEKIRAARIKADSPEAEREIPPFPSDSVVLKTSWEIIYPDPKTHLASLDIWNPEKEENDPALLTQGYWHLGAKGWSKAVTVNVTKRYECKDGDYTDDAVIPLGCFYFIKITPALSSYWSNFARSVNPNSLMTDRNPYAVLMAVHVTTKEIGEWVWATFWWYHKTSHPSYGCDATCRSILKGNKWRHFLMDTTLSGSTPLEDDQGHKICFNRYLEEKMAYGIVSNCIQCHRRAVYKPSGRDECAYPLGHLPRCTDTEKGSLPKCADVVPAECRQNDQNYYQESLQTDFLWTIADAKDSRKQAVQDAFVKLLKTPPSKH